ncbi:hypothetical protein DFJ63DRAFT_88109 [Scheffersomyces coipomensis]|uniref:uncharacterized protein n=1 Tax=Scheffersomyces coipomensis TaxID=1788519 RepID=UPI00315DBE16
MNSPRHEDDSLFIPKKRILGASQINNRIKKLKPSESLEFDMVRIPSGNESMSHPPSRIPSLNGSNNDDQNIQLDHRLSNIPKPKLPIKAITSEVRSSPSYNLGSIQTLLNKRGPVLKPTSYHSNKSNNHTNLILNPIFNIEYYNDQEHQLEQQLNSKLEEFRRIDNEVSELRRENHKFKKRFEELTTKLMEKSRRLINLEESITSNVSNQEKLVNIDIQGFQSKLNNELNEIEFSLKNELKQSYLFKDEEIEQKILELEEQVEEGEKELGDLKSSKLNLITQESEQLENELSLTLTTKQTELDELLKKVTSINEEVAVLDEQLSNIKQRIILSNDENIKLEQNIVKIESNMNNFNDTKRELLRQISTLDQELSEIKQQDATWESTLKNSSKEFEMYNQKFIKFENQRRIMENSIMNYENKLRVYIKTSIPAQSDNSLSFNNKQYQFNKLFTANESTKSIMDECALFIQSSLKPSTINLCTILSGNNDEQFVSAAISHSYQNLLSTFKMQPPSSHVSFSFKSIGIKHHQIFDLLNSDVELSQEDIDTSSWGFPLVPSQPMILDPNDEDSKRQFDQIMNSIIHTAEEMIQVHVITINTNHANLIIENNLIFVDITKLNDDEQFKSMNKFTISNFTSNFHDKVFQYVRNQCTSLCISNLVENDDEQLSQWLNTLQTLNKLDQPKK